MGELFDSINQLLSRQMIFLMDNDYVNAVFESLQSNKSRVDGSELLLVINVSLSTSTFATS